MEGPGNHHSHGTRSLSETAKSCHAKMFYRFLENRARVDWVCWGGEVVRGRQEINTEQRQ